MRQLLQFTIIGVALAGAAACAHVQAAAPAASPLDVPAPPPRVVVPPSTDVTDPEPSAPATTPAPVAPAHPSAPPPVRPQEKPPTAPPTSTAPPPDASTAPPLETTSDTSTLRNQTLQILNNANRDLGRVDRAALSQEAQAQYDRAKSFVRQADNALKEGNLTYAHTMAEKAAALAGQLPKTKAGNSTSASTARAF